ncbi:MAG: hypothetical protein WCF84_00305 [Anaerolineae bacterium]
MEPTYWDYFAPYQPDIEQALHQLQEHIFEHGEYEDPLRAAAESEGKPYTPPGSIEELRQRCGDSGTHSILDMRHVSAHPAANSVSPVPGHRLHELLGTDKPDLIKFENELQEADRSEAEILDEVETGQGRYFILYKEGHPNQIFFHGSSGA